MRLQIAIPEEHVHPDVLNAAAEAVTRLDEKMISSGAVPPFDFALGKGMRWQPEPPGAERFDHAGLVTQRNWGDCDDLAPYKAATLRVTGVDPGAHVDIVPSGPKKFHAMVRLSSGELLRGSNDPSVQAGMRSASSVSGMGDGYGPAACRCLSPLHVPTLAVRQVGGSTYAARCDLPWIDAPYRMASTTRARSPRESLALAIEGACMCGDAAGFASSDDLARLAALSEELRSGRDHPALHALYHQRF